MNLTEWVDLLVKKAHRIQQQDHNSYSGGSGSSNSSSDSRTEEKGDSHIDDRSRSSRAKLDLKAILTVLQDILSSSSPSYIEFLFPLHLQEEEERLENEEAAGVQRQGHLPSLVKAWLEGQITRIEEGIRL